MRKGLGPDKTWTLQLLVGGGLDQPLLPCAVQILLFFARATMARKFGSTEVEDQTVVNLSPAPPASIMQIGQGPRAASEISDPNQAGLLSFGADPSHLCILLWA